MQYKLESLRGIAACLVVLFHSPFNYGEKSLGFISHSYLFVDFFFILSGFVMSLAYSSRISEGMSFGTYSMLRLGRLYPLHLIMLLVWVPYILIKQYLFDSGFGGTTQIDTNNLMSFFSNVFLLNSMGLHDHLSWNYPAWSISTEFFTCIAFFGLTKVLDRKSSLTIPLLIAVGCYGLIVSLGRNSLDITYDYGFFRCLGAFYLGVFVNRISRVIQFSKSPHIKIWVSEALCIVAVIAAVSFSGTYFLLFIPVILVFSFTIFVFSQDESGFLGRALLTKPLKRIGTWSYSIYMTHAIVLAGIANFFEYVLKWNLESQLGLYAVALNFSVLFVVIVISKYSYLLIEKPFREKSRMLANKYGKSMLPIAKAATD